MRASGGHARKRTAYTRDALTAQEALIAQLASAGASNQQIAEQLFLSPATVAYHLRKVYAKLGISSRGELARLLPHSRTLRRPPRRHAELGQLLRAPPAGIPARSAISLRVTTINLGGREPARGQPSVIVVEEGMTVADAPALSFSSVPGRWVVAVTVLGSGIAALDATVVDIALPAIGREFHVGVGALQWVMAGYSLALAAFLLIGGSLGDRSGRRRVYLIGVVWFTLASAACGFAPTAGFLIATRVLQGAGAARRCSRRAAWRSWKRRSCPPTGAGRSGPGRA